MINHNAMNEAIGKALRKARKSKKITQVELSDRTGLARSTITKYELGQIEVSMVNFVMICDALGVNYVEVLQSVPVVND